MADVSGAQASLLSIPAVRSSGQPKVSTHEATDKAQLLRFPQFVPHPIQNLTTFYNSKSFKKYITMDRALDRSLDEILEERKQVRVQALSPSFARDAFPQATG